MLRCIITYLLLTLAFKANAQYVYVCGNVKDSITNQYLSNVQVSIDNQKSIVTDKKGYYSLKFDSAKKYQIKFFLHNYKQLTKTMHFTNNDTVWLNVKLAPLSYSFPEVSILGLKKADTVFGTWKFSIADFEFYDDKILLLTFTKNLKHPSLVLVDYNQKIIMQKELDFEVLELTKDYENNIVMLAEDKNYYVKIINDDFILSWIDKETYKYYVQPFIIKKDSIIYYSDFQKDYPQFSYYSYCSIDSSYKPIKKIVNEEYLHEYNMEYYFLHPKEKVEARNIALYYNIDVHMVAASMSGLTTSIFYEPLYDPMFIINDTICIFNHCNNILFKYDKSLQQIDSIPINYHHPKNWREWKKKLIADENNSSVYSLYEKNGYYWIKQINLHTGNINGSFKLLNPNIEQIKIKDGYVYYVYRPFDSLQQKFLYKELIILDK